MTDDAKNAGNTGLFVSAARSGPQRLSYIWIIHTTSQIQNADTEDKFRLDIAHPTIPQELLLSLPFPDLPSPDERERGVTEQYKFDLTVAEGSINTDLAASDIRITILGNDAWLPDSVWAIGEDVHGIRGLLAGVPNWPTGVHTGWFSTDLSEGAPTRSLDIQP